jgi:flagellin-like protein
MKAVSPLVAAVLLIAVTMTIAGILAYWGAGFVRMQTASWENSTVAGNCNFADFKIYSCRYNDTSSKITLNLENLRKVELKDLSIYYFFTNGSVSPPVYINDTLPGSMIKTFSISDVPSDFTKLTIKTQCPDISATDDCR